MYSGAMFMCIARIKFGGVIRFAISLTLQIIPNWIEVTQSGAVLKKFGLVLEIYLSIVFRTSRNFIVDFFSASI